MRQHRAVLAPGRRGAKFLILCAERRFDRPGRARASVLESALR